MLPESKTDTNLAVKLKNAVAYETAGKYESALMSLDEAISIKADYEDAWLIKGVIYSKLGKCSEASNCFDKVIALAPKYPIPWRLKAATFVSINQHEKAVDCFEKALELDPLNLEYRLGLALSLQKLKRFGDALNCYSEAKKAETF